VLALLVLSAAVHFYYASSPRGVYLDPYFDPQTFWVFKDGKVYLTTEKGLKYTGPYSKLQGRWVVHNGYVKPSLFGLRWYDPQFNNGGMRERVPAVAAMLHAQTLSRSFISLLRGDPAYSAGLLDTQ
jgi:hypothetical protein